MPVYDVLSGELVALASVILVDLVLAGDNAIVVGAVAARLPAELRPRAILFGVLAAMVLRIAFAVVASSLLAIIGLVLAGGLLLLWVAWKMWRELEASRVPAPAGAAAGAADPGAAAPARPVSSFRSAIWQIVVADVSMSLDNVLAVAGTARHHVWVLVFGLALSVALMGFAANLVARLIERWRWLGYLGLAVVAVVAVSMIVEGTKQVLAYAA
ncbi:MAG TPA: YjbE family putative metal transport protein [Alphaproteobacteria bacterium]